MLFLKAYRQRVGLSQIALAAKAGVSQTAICLTEMGTTRTPSMETLVKLAEALDCDPALLMWNIEDLNDEERNELGL